MFDVDYCSKLSHIGAILIEKAKNSIMGKGTIPPAIRAEAELAERIALGIENVEALGGEKTSYSCPDCGGALWEIIQGNLHRYRCHTGHMYTQNELLSRMHEELEQTFYIVLRMMDERKHLLQKMAVEEESKGWIRSSKNKEQRIKVQKVASALANAYNK